MTAFVTATQPLLTAVIAERFTGESQTRRQWCGMLLGLLAVAVVIGGQITLGGNIAAYIVLLCSLCALSLGTLLDRAATLKAIARRGRPCRAPTSTADTHINTYAAPPTRPDCKHASASVRGGLAYNTFLCACPLSDPALLVHRPLHQ